MGCELCRPRRRSDELEAEWREIKASYTRTDPKGKFYLKIEKIGPEVAST